MSETWKEAVINEDGTVGQVIKILEKTTLKIVVITDSEFKVKGVVTDGDIRSALLKGLSLDTPVSEISNKEPVIVHFSTSTKDKIKMVTEKKIFSLPIVDDDGRLINIEVLSEFLENRFDNPVFIMAGGFGTRLAPLTNDCPKPMLPIGDRPILETLVRHLKSLGFWNFFISVHYLPEVIKQYFGDGSTYNVSIRYVDESSPCGTAGALSLLPESSLDLPVLMINGDILTNMDFTKLLAYHSSLNSTVTVCSVEHKHQVPYGVVECRGNAISKIKEKPTYSYYVNTGIYVLNKSFIKNIKKDSYVDMPNIVNQKIIEGDKINVYPLKEYWLDIGKMHDYEKAQVDYGELFQ